MSVDNDEQKTQDESTIEQVTEEQLTEAGAEVVESSTQDGEETVIEAIDVADLAGTQPEKTEADKERNDAYAAKRVATKKLKELEKQLEQGHIPESYAYKAPEVGEKPRLADFTNEDRLYSDFNGDTTLALASYNEAKEDWAESNSSVVTGRTSHAEEVKAQVKAQIQQEEEFEKSIETLNKSVKGLDKSISKAEELIGRDAFVAVRDTIGVNAPLVLGAIGGNGTEQQMFIDAATQSTTTGNPRYLIQYLTRLEDKVMSNLPSATQISNAASETPVGGTAKSDSGLDHLIDKASKSGDADEYRRLMNIKRGRVAA